MLVLDVERKVIEMAKCKKCKKESDDLCVICQLCPKCHVIVFGDT